MQESSFIALCVVVLLYQLLEPAVQDGWGEVLSLDCLGKADEGAPEGFLFCDVVESSPK